MLTILFVSSLLSHNFSSSNQQILDVFLQGMSKFIAASRQATELDKMRILLETRIQEIRDECKKWAEVATKAKEEVMK